MYKTIAALLILFLPSFCLANETSPYSGEHTREIKSLSTTEREGYLAGKGMGLAKAAELNGYPGPRHVLDLSRELTLSNEQISKSNALFNTMQSDAMRLGSILIEQEIALDKLFANGNANHTALESALASIGKIKSEIRQSHLAAHIEQKKILSQKQIALYIQHRGYNSAPTDHHKSSHHQNNHH